MNNKSANRKNHVGSKQSLSSRQSSRSANKSNIKLPWTDYIIEWLIYFSVILVPLIFVPQLNSIFTFPKLYVFRMIILVIILLWSYRFFVRSEVKFFKMKFGIFLLAYGGISIINTFITVNTFTSMYGVYGRFIGIFTLINLLLWVYIIFSELKSRKEIITLLWFLLSSAFVVALYGILQGLDLWVNVFDWTLDPADRVFSTIGHGNHVAGYLGMCIMVCFGLFLVTKKRAHKAILSIFSLAFFVALFMTASRGGFAAIIITAIFWIVFFFKDYWKYIVAAVIALIIGVVAFYQPLSELSVVKRTTSTIEFIKQGNIPDRVSWLLSTFEMIKDKPYFGHGLSTYRDIYNNYRRIDYRVPDDSQDTITPQTAHNEYLTIWAQQGTIGLVAYLMMIGAAIFYAVKFIRKSKNKNDRIIVMSLLTGIVIYLVQVSISFGVITTLFMLYTFIGLIVSYINLDETKQYLAIKLKKGWKGLVILFALFIVIGGMTNILSYLSAEYYYKKANVLASQRNFDKTIDYYASAISFMPFMSEYYEGYADFLFEVGVRFETDEEQEIVLLDALTLYNQSLNINENFPFVHANKALVASRLADINKDNPNEYDRFKEIAISELIKATEIAKNNPLYPYKLGKMYLFFDMKDEARLSFEEVVKIRDPYEDTQGLLDST